MEPVEPDPSTGRPGPAIERTRGERLSLEDVVARAMPAVVLVETATGRGSAFFVAPDTLLTNIHVVGSASTVTIRHLDGTTRTARVTASAAPFDLAVLKIANADPRQATIPLGSAFDARPGQEVIAIGSALGTLQNTVTRGIVSAVRQSGPAMLVQTDAAVNPGNSGGPLLDRDGAAIGVTTMGYVERQGLNFAVAADHAQVLIDGGVPAAVPPRIAVADHREISPAVPSSTDRQRTDGEDAYARQLADLARRADNLDDAWSQFRESCYEGRIAGHFERPWFALFDERAMQGAVPAGCAGWFGQMRREATTLRDAVASADQAARRAGVYPGVRRDTARAHRLDYPGRER